MKSWVDVSYGVHDDCRSHTGGAISFGWGVLVTKCQKQKLNMKSWMGSISNKMSKAKIKYEKFNRRRNSRSKRLSTKYDMDSHVFRGTRVHINREHIISR